MNKQTCDMIRDLLPLYADDVCSEESRKIVNAHLATCPACSEMLLKMNQKVAIAAEKDITAIRRIQKCLFFMKRIQLIACILLPIAALFSGYIFAVTDCSMDYEKYNLAENVWVEEDSDSQLWFCMKGNVASLSSYVYPTISDTDGGHMGYADQHFDKEKKCGFGVTLKMFRIAKLVPWKMNSYEQRIKVRSDLDYVFYYDDATDTEYVLWGEKPQGA